MSGQDVWGLPAPDDTNPDFLSLQDLRDQVMIKNTEVLAALAAVEVNRQRVQQSKADLRPTVDVVVSKTWAQSDTINTLNQRYDVTGLGFQMSVPIYDGGGISAQTRQSEFGVVSAEQDLRTLQQKLEIQIQSDWDDAQAAKERMGAAGELVVASKQQLIAAQMGIKAGTRTWADVAQLEIQLAQRKSDQLDEIVRLLRSRLKLISNLPTTEEVWNGLLNSWSKIDSTKTTNTINK